MVKALEAQNIVAAPFEKEIAYPAHRAILREIGVYPSMRRVLRKKVVGNEPHRDMAWNVFKAQLKLGEVNVFEKVPWCLSSGTHPDIYDLFEVGWPGAAYLTEENDVIDIQGLPKPIVP